MCEFRDLGCSLTFWPGLSGHDVLEDVSGDVERLLELHGLSPGVLVLCRSTLATAGRSTAGAVLLLPSEAAAEERLETCVDEGGGNRAYDWRRHEWGWSSRGQQQERLDVVRAGAGQGGGEAGAVGVGHQAAQAVAAHVVVERNHDVSEMFFWKCKFAK